jgi:hypothetical protein
MIIAQNTGRSQSIARFNRRVLYSWRWMYVSQTSASNFPLSWQLKNNREYQITGGKDHANRAALIAPRLYPAHGK